MYTSGSTGKPKGVMIEHISVVNLSNYYNEIFTLKNKNIVHMSNVSFDTSVVEIFPPLIYGASVYVIRKELALDSKKFIKFVEENQVNIAQFVPMTLKELLAQNTKLESLDAIIVGGDKLEDTLKDEILSLGYKLTNHYGPTECTVDATVARCQKSKSSIGTPIANTKAYILDKDKNPTPIGVPGELCISGDGLARGYLNRPELTTEKFVDNPFSPDEKMYRTGDLASWQSDGNITFLGRIDNQVKIRGYRIEIGEIESQLLKHEEIKEAVVVDKMDQNGLKYLTAYVVSDDEVTMAKMRAHLSNELPDYMIPSYFMQIDKIPYTHNGKVDRKALPEIDGSIQTGVEYVAPTNKIEHKLIQIWQEVLKVEHLGLNHNFFEVGGHSLKATVLVSKIHKELNVEVPLGEIFKKPTIKELAKYIQKAEENIYTSISPVEEADYYPVSSSQKRIFIQWQLDEQSTAYNMPTAIILEGDLDLLKIEQAINGLIERHEALRTSFELVNNEPVQKIHKKINIHINYSEAKEENLKELAEQFRKPFDLSKAPLLRVNLLKFEAKKYLLLFDMHHIISDGVSSSILIRDFGYLYQDKNLPQLRIQYKDYASWHNSLMDSETMEKMSQYWIEKLNNFTYTKLPVRSSNSAYEGKRTYAILGEAITKRIDEFCKKHKVTKFAFVLAVFKIVIMKTINQKDLTIGITAAGRKDEELENILGVFLNLLVIRTQIQKEAVFTDYLYNVRDNLMEAQEYQDYPYEKLYAKVKEELNFKENSLFSIMFNYMPYQESNNEMNLDGISVRPYKIEEVEPKYGLALSVNEGKDYIALNAVFKNNLEEYIIENMLNSFETVIQTVLKNEDILIKQISLADGNNLDIYSQDFELESFVDSQSLDSKIRSIALKIPAKTAIEQGVQSVSYIELEERANQIANSLNVRIGDNKNIAVILGNSIELVEAILGIIKCGGVFVPIDPDFPENRIKLMIDEIEADWLITCSAWLDKLDRMMEGENRKLNALVLDLTANTRQFNNLNLFEFNDNLQKEYLSPAEIQNEHCYIYFTSGSTGKPKAILGKHISLKHFINWEIKEFGVEESFRISQLVTPSFDAILRDIFVPLCAGATLCIPANREIVLNPQSLREWIDDSKITLMHMVPTLFKALMKEIEDSNCFEELQYILLAGEMLRGNDLTKFFKLFANQIELVNLYGTTETTLVKLFYRVKESDVNRISIPVGKPMGGTQVMILNDDMQICQPGSIGEIYIRTPFISAGYYNNSESTSKVFIKNPFSDDPTDLIYKTGDIGRVLLGGNVEILGRADHQVKLRGVRIELGEIENQLLQLAMVKEAVAVAIEDEINDKYLCAYLEVGDQKPEVGEIREFLQKRLPDYMIPNYFVLLEKMPHTPNGKIDRKALPEPDLNNTEVQYVAPQNEIEEKLEEIWSEILKKDCIGINHNFFNLGGHSLKAISLVTKIYKELNVKVPLKEVFINPTIKGLADYIKNAEKADYSSIQPVEERSYYPASSAQKRLYILNQMEKVSTVYNMPRAIMVEGVLERTRLEQSINDLINRHETLRTSFETIEGEIVQFVHKEVDFKVTSIEETKGDITEILKQFVQPFDLKKASLLRVGLVELAEERHLLLFDLHHIISDDMSMGIILQEFVELYEDKEIPVLPIQYKDFSVWQNKLFKTGVIKKQEEYWIKRFSDEARSNAIPVLNMPTDYPRPTKYSFEGDCINFKLDKELTKNLERIAKETGSTMYIVLLTGVNILLAKYSNQEDIIVGSPIAGRSHPDLEKIIGMFVNTLPMRNQPEGHKTYEEFLREVKENALKAYENQDYQFEELVDHLNLKRDLSRNPLYNVMFVLHNTMLQNMNSEELTIEGLKFIPFSYEKKTSKFDLTFSASEVTSAGVNQEIVLNLEYSIKLFKRETVERMISHFINILKVVVANPKIKLNEIEMFTEEEKNKILYEFNNTDADYPRDKTIHEVFEEQVEKVPNNIAVVFEDQRLTYRELNEKSNQLARRLRDQGVKSESIVAIVTERSVEMVIGIIAILKSGGAYLPIDPAYPEERIQYSLEDSNTQILLTQSYLLDKFIYTGEIICVDNENVYQGDSSNLECINKSENLAYIIYTSGTTGRPKGVMIEHRNVIRLLFNDKIQFVFTDKDIWTMFHSFCFDFSVWEMYGALLYGGKLIVVPKLVAQDTAEFLKLLKRHKVTVLNQTPTAFFNLINEEMQFSDRELNLRYIIFGGETLKPAMLKDWRVKYPNTKLINMYGITETTVHVTFKEITEDEIELNLSNIGKPIPTLTTYIMDQHLRVQPIGIPGELCVGGEGVGRGYLNKPDLTAVKFCKNPYDHHEKLYRSGDLVRMLPDGEIEYLGRIDQQVKIRGFRIELGEIESQLLRHEAIKEAVVLAQEDSSRDKYLCAYLVGERELVVSELREHLSKKLPDYMIPVYFVQLDKMPLTSNGKMDRKALLKSNNFIATGIEYAAPTNEIEQKLVELWKEILEVDKIGVHDNFFELGGHSLKATILMSKIHKELNVEISLSEVFKKPTIKELAEYIAVLEKNLFSSIQPAEESDYYPANYYPTSSAQKRIFIQNQFEGAGVSYNMPGAVIIEGGLDSDKFGQVFRQIVKRHETLRTSFEMLDGQIMQKIHGEVDLDISFMQISEDAVNEILEEFIAPFDLSKVPLLRIGLAKITKDRHVLFFDMHHIISDGMSMDILMREFVTLYQGQQLPNLTLQYKDFSVWQNNLFTTDIIEKQEKYWLNTFADLQRGEIPVLNMPTDYSRPSIQSFRGDNIEFEIDGEIKKRLKELAVQTGSSLFMVLLAAYNVLFYKYTGQEDFVIGTPIAGRRHADLENIIGMFVNMLALRNAPSCGKTFREFMDEVRENTLKAFENQDYQFEELVEKLHLQRDLSRNPLFDVVFTLQDATHQSVMQIEDLRFNPYTFENKISKFDMTLEAIEASDKMWFNIEYCVDLFTEETMKRIGSHFINILREITKNPEVKLAEVNILSETERRQLLDEFNATEMEYAKTKTLYELFEAQVEKSPNDIALVFANEKLTYNELNKRVNQLAYRLRELGVERDEIVGIMAERSIDLIIGILSVLKAGGAYMPIDPDYPVERITYMLNDSKARILLTHNGYADQIEYNSEIIDLAERNIYIGDKVNFENINRPEDLVYVMYTSGSTGKPKGVMIEHRGVVSLSKYYNQMFKLDEGKNVLHMSNVSFDTSVVEIFPPLIYGATVYIIGRELALDKQRFIRFIQDNQIHFVQFVPMTLQEILGYSDKVESLETVIVGGDKLDDKVKDKVLARGYHLTNHYGPTEGTVDAIVAQCAKGKTTIGKPIANTKVFILDKDDNLTPVGVPGELCISGVGLARGYLNRPELTAEKFVLNPLLSGEKIYRTGDLASWQPDGSIIFHGRIDNQVKIRGYRIELGEIEKQLLKHEDVTAAVVVDLVDSSGIKYLCAYLVIDRKSEVGGENVQLSVTELRQHLAKELPDYMIPSHFMQIERIPLTHNGKVDRNALPEPEGSFDTGVEYVAPSNEVEEKMVVLWQEVLGIELIGINHNFFELGGHSLKIMTLLSKIQKEFNVEVSFSEVFKRPTIKELADYVQKAEINIYASIQPVEEAEYYLVSSSQRRIYIQWQLAAQSKSYNMPSAIILEGELDRIKFDNAIRGLVKRHEALRTSFELVDGEPMQRVHKHVEITADYLEVQEENLKDLIEQFVQPFDLGKAPLLRVVLIRFAHKRHLLIFDMHHIISDGLSMAILTSDFTKLYEGRELSPLRIHYKDYTAWHNSLMESDTMESLGEYWIRKLDNFAYTALPESTISSTKQSVGKYKQVRIDECLNERIMEFCLKHKMTKFAFLLGVFKIIIMGVIKQDDILIGIPVAGRKNAELEKMIGVFLNVLVVRTKIQKEQGFKEYLMNLRNNLMEAQEHQDYPYESLYAKAKEVWNFSQNSLFSILFNYMPYQENEDLKLDGIIIRPYSLEENEPKYSLTLYVNEGRNTISLNALFKNSLEENLVEIIMDSFLTVIQTVLDQEDILIKEISLAGDTNLDQYSQDFDMDFDNDDFF